jgi:hypothetical protein
LANNKRIAVRGMTVSLERVEEASAQLDFWTDCHCHPERSEGGMTRHGPLRFAQGDNAPLHALLPRRRTLQHALDRIHSRYGTRGMTRGSRLAALTARDTPRL